jgi:hypothetical protein
MGTAAVFLLRPGHTPITFARENFGDRQTKVLRDRDHNPTDATR